MSAKGGRFPAPAEGTEVEMPRLEGRGVASFTCWFSSRERSRVCAWISQAIPRTILENCESLDGRLNVLCVGMCLAGLRFDGPACSLFDLGMEGGTGRLCVGL